MKLSLITARLLSIISIISFTIAPLQSVHAEAMSSGSYKIQEDSLNFGGGKSNSGSYIIEDTAGEVGTGELTGGALKVQAGYQQTDTETGTNGSSGNIVASAGGADTGTSVSTPSVNVMYFNAVPSVLPTQSILLSWKYPLDGNIVSVRIIRSDKFFPATMDEGEVIYDGETNGDAESVIDHNVKPGVRYYYALFAKNKKGEWSSGMLTQARIVPVDEKAGAESKDPFANIPQALDVDPAFLKLSLDDFDFIQDGRFIDHAGDTIALDANKIFTVRLNYTKVPEMLKTIAISLAHPTDPTKVFTFLLRVNKDKTAYEAVIGSLEQAGIYKLQAVVLDYKNQSLKRLSGDVRAFALGGVENVVRDVLNNNRLLYGTLALLILAFILALIFVAHSRKKRDVIVGLFLLVSLLSSLLPTRVSAAINQQINYQGKLTNNLNQAVGGNYHVRFNLYTSSNSVTPIWTQTTQVSVSSGLFSTMLSNFSGVDFNQTLYLGVEIGGYQVAPVWDGEMSPRKVIGAVPAAFVADTLDGLDSTQFLRSDTGVVTQGYFVATSTTASVFPYASTTALTVSGLAFLNGGFLSLASSTLQNFTGLNATTTNATTTSFFATTASSTNLFASLLRVGGNTLITNLSGFVGIGTTSPGDRLDISDGRLILTDSDVNHGVTGYATFNSYGRIEAESGTDGGLAIKGMTDANGTSALRLMGILGVTDPTDTLPAVYIRAAKSDGSTVVTTLGDLETVFQVSNDTTKLLTILGNGNFGIGTTSPNNKLDVAGNGYFSGNLFVGGAITATSSLTLSSVAVNSLLSTNASGVVTATSTPTFGNFNATSTVATSTIAGGLAIEGSGFVYDFSTNNVGIGTAKPGYPLQVFGNAAIGGDASGAGNATVLNVLGNVTSTLKFGYTADIANYNNTISNSSWGGVGQNMSFALTNGGTAVTAMTLLSNGNVGIGTTSPYRTLSVSGSGVFTGGDVLASTFTATSSISTPALTLSSVAVNSLLSTNASGVVTATSTPTFGNFNATSTVATSTISTGGFAIGTNQFVVQQNSGNVGIGTAAPSSKLDVTFSQSGTSDGLSVFNLAPTYTGAAAGTFNYGLNSLATANFSSGSVTSFVGARFDALNTSATAPANMTGLRGRAESSAGTTNLYGATFDTVLSGTGNATNAYGVYIDDATESSSGAITNQYGLYLASQTKGSTLNYGIYSAGGQNYFGGNVGIGTTTPGSILSVAGVANFASTGSTLYSTLTVPTLTATSSISTPSLTLSSVAINSLLSTNASGVVTATSTPTFGNFNATSTVATSTVAFGLSVANLANTSMTAGSIPFFGAGGYMNQNNASLFWDAANARLGVGTAAPATALEVVGHIKLSATGNQLQDFNGNNLLGNSAGTVTLGNAAVNVALNIQNGSGADFSYKRGSVTDFFIGSTGNVGIGTTTPDSTLTVKQTTGDSNNGILKLASANATEFANMTFWNGATSKSTDARNWQISSNYQVMGNLDIMRSTTNVGNPITAVLSLNSDGHLGVGSTSPLAKLSVKGDGSSTAINFQTTNSSNSPLFTILDSGAITAAGTLTLSSVAVNSLLSTNASGVVTATSTPTFGNFNATSTVATSTISTGGFAVGTSQFVVQSGSGKVGIGTSTPAFPLDIYSTGSDAKIRLGGGGLNSQNGIYYDASGGGDSFYSYSSSLGYSIFNNTDSRSDFTIDNSGKVGIGTIIPGKKLEVVASDGNLLRLSYDSINTADWDFTRNVSTGALSIQGSQVGNNNLLLVPTSGNVGIGTTTPGSILSVAGVGNFASTGSTLYSTLNMPSFTATSTTATSTIGTGGLAVGTSTPFGNGLFTVGTSTPLFYIDRYTGNVGVGTTTGTDKLAVSGAISSILDNTNTPTLLSSTTLSQTSIQNMTISGRYAYIVSREASIPFSVVDISNPNIPTVTYSGTPSLSGPVGIAVSGKYAYIGDRNATSFTILDITKPAVPVYKSSTGMTTTGSFSNPLVSGRYAYVAEHGTNNLLHVIDISNPSAPVIVGSVTVGSATLSLFMYQNYVFSTNRDSNNITVIDVSSPSNPTIVNTLGSITGSLYLVGSGKYVYAISAAGVITVIDVSTPTAISISKTVDLGVSSFTSPVLSGRYIYGITGASSNKISAIDISNPLTPRIASTYTVPVGTFSSLGVSGRYLYATNGISFLSFDLHGVESNSVFAHAFEAGTLQVQNKAIFDASVFINKDLNVGFGGLLTQGDFTAMGAGYFGGLLGIGTTSPYARLSVAGSSIATTTFALRPFANQTANIVDIYSTTGALTSVINSSGNWGIGTTTPNNKLDVNGNGYFSGSLFVGGAITATSSLTLSSVAVNSLLSTNASGVVTATSTPTFGNFNATSTTATSTIAGGFTAGAGNFIVDYSTGNSAFGSVITSDRVNVNGNIAIPNNCITNGIANNTQGYCNSSGVSNISGAGGVNVYSSLAALGSQTLRLSINATSGDVNVANSLSASKTILGGTTGSLTQIQGAPLPKTYIAFGDSITSGDLITTPYPQGVGAFKGLTTTNAALGNRMVLDFATSTYSYQPVASSTNVYTYSFGANDSRTYLASADLQSYFKAGLQAEVAFLTATSTTATSSSMTFSGSWTTNSLNNAGIGKYTSDSGATASAEVVGRTVYVGVPVMVGGNGQFSITIDGVNKGTFNNYQSGDITSRVGMTYGPKLLRFTNLSDNVHTVTFTRVAGTAYIDWIGGVGNGQGPSVYVLGIIRQSANGYINNGSSDANIAVYNKLIRTAVQELSSDGLNIAFVDVTQRLDNIDGSDIIAGDGVNGYGIHPTQQGTNKMRDAVLEAMSPWAGAKEKQSVKNLGYIFGADGLTFDNATGYLGIGTTSPYSALSVVGQIVGSNFVATSTTATSTIGTGGFAVGTSQFVVQQNSGNVGIGTATPTEKLTISGDGASLAIRTTSDPTNYYAKLQANYDSNNSVNLFGTAGIELLRQNFNTGLALMPTSGIGGNVGIGTTSPWAALSVSGKTTTTNEVVQSWAYGGGSGNNQNYHLDLVQNIPPGGGVVNWSFNNTNNGTKYSNVLNLNQGKVGIGSTTPLASLSVSGATSNTSAYNTVFADSTGLSRFTLLDSGLLGLGGGNYGNTAPLTSLHINAFNSPGFGQSGRSDYKGTILLDETGNGPQVASGIEFQNSGTGAGYGYKIYTNNGNDTFGIATRFGSATWTPETFVIKQQTGNTGIGTTTPLSKLTISGGVSIGANYNIAAPTNGMIVEGNVGIGTSTPISTLSIQGSLCVRNTGSCGTTAGTIYATTNTVQAIDLAENYPTNDDTLVAGEIVSLEGMLSTYIHRASIGEIPLGIVSTAPGILLGSDVLNSKPVALSGRVPVKVNNEGGAIAVGDRITLSSVAGVGKKQTTSSETIGIALEEMTGVTGTINVFVNLKQHTMTSEFMIDSSGNIGIGTTSPAYKLHVMGDVAAQSFVNISTRDSKKDIDYVDSTDSTNVYEKIKNIKIARYHYKDERNTTPLHLGLIAEEAPSEILSASGKGVDIYKLVSFTLLGVQELQKKTDAIEVRLSKLESTAFTATSTPALTASSTVALILGEFKALGAEITASAANFVAVVTTKLTVGTATKPTGITLYDDVTGAPYCIRMSGGSMKSVVGECVVGTVTPTPSAVPTPTTTTTPVTTPVSTTPTTSSTPTMSTTPTTSTTPETSSTPSESSAPTTTSTDTTPVTSSTPASTDSAPTTSSAPETSSTPSTPETPTTTSTDTTSTTSSAPASVDSSSTTSTPASTNSSSTTSTPTTDSGSTAPASSDSSSAPAPAPASSDSSSTTP